MSASASRNAHAIARHPESVTPEADYLLYSENFQHVGGLFTAGSDGEFDGFSSGVLIDEHWVLTSGHGVLEVEHCASCIEEDFLFVLGPTTHTGVLEFKTTPHVFLHPDYHAPEDGVDLALLYFEDAFTAVAPAVLSGHEVQVGDLLSMVGFGPSGVHFGSPDAMSNGIRRGSTNVVNSLTRYDGYAAYDWARIGFEDFQPLGGQLIPGDSGGGWFVDNGNGHELVAITSGGSGFIAYGMESTGRLIEPSLAWIAETMASVIPSGDFNADGYADGDDFLRWQRGFGEIYDAEDLANWEINFGNSPPLIASVVVPEPSSFLPTSLAGCTLLHRRRPRQLARLAHTSKELDISYAASAYQVDVPSARSYAASA